ncbi:15945_t:CDS:2 [Dentiscutata erythropus]|uniref:15945_t:CDS:1 n=1 Tax=Dentiscutata erythropus TaxID=1348616 RepID=A0A9N9GD18_9GLOM|nr:15945_t:CDS:2 [Dentiscutata erythropus]
MFTGKFVVENLKQYVTASSICVIAEGERDHEFEASEIPLCAAYYQYNPYTNSRNVQMKLRLFYPTNAQRFLYLHANNSIKPARTFIASGFIRCVTSEFTIVEVTDIDFVTTINTAQNVQSGSSSVASGHCSDIDLIAEDVDVESIASRAPKRPRILTSRSSKKDTNSSPTVQNRKGKGKLSDLALNCLEPVVMDNVQDRRVHIENASNDDDLEFLGEQEFEKEQEVEKKQEKKKETKSTSNKRSSKKKN